MAFLWLRDTARIHTRSQRSLTRSLIKTKMQTFRHQSKFSRRQILQDPDQNEPNLRPEPIIQTVFNAAAI